MEIMKHLVQIGSSTIRLSSIVRITHDRNDNTVKVWFHGVETGWMGCSPSEYSELLNAWSAYLDQTIKIEPDATKYVV